MALVISLTMQVTRTGDHYHGSLTRVRDQACLPFTGVLEMIAVLERLTSSRENSPPDGGDEGCVEVHDA